MAIRLSKEQKEEIVKIFNEGATINEISGRYKCSKLTITRNLKKSIGESNYKKILDNNKNFKNSTKKNKDLNSFEVERQKDHETFRKKNLKEEFSANRFSEDEFMPNMEFMELAPLNEEIDEASRKDFSSVSINDIEFPNHAYMIVQKTIELEIKLLKNFPEWQFLSEDDLNRKTIQVYFDLKVAKRNCNKDQKVIKVPNTNVFKLVSPILISRGITRIISEDKLIAL